MDQMNNESGIDMGFDTELLLRESSFDSYLDLLNTEFSAIPVTTQTLSSSTPGGPTSIQTSANSSSVPTNINTLNSAFYAKSKPLSVTTTAPNSGRYAPKH